MKKEEVIVSKDELDRTERNYRRTLIAGGVIIGALIAGLTYTIVRSNAARGAASGIGTRGVLNSTASFNFSNKPSINITTVLDREGRGHPGWPVRNLETKRIFLSQKEAADAFGIPQSVLSGHLNGKFGDVDGLHFERINLN